MNQLEDIFNTEDFKKLSWGKRVWVRIQVALIQTIRMI